MTTPEHPADDPDPAAPAAADLHADTVAICAGRVGDGPSLAPVLWPTTTFAAPSVAEARRMATSTGADRFYTRYGNPTVKGFEDAVAQLEGAEAARAFASGMGAVSGVVLGLCSAGDHIVAQRQLYAATQLLLQAVCPRFGIDVTFVDGTAPGAFADAAIPGKTTLILAETPANPKLDVIDLAEVAAAGAKGPVTVVDATFATPILQQTLSHGIDLVLHSATKGIAGHNDATLGVVAGSRELIDWLWGFAVLQGASASPWDAANATRGIRTLPIRVERQCATALAVARALDDHPLATDVRYPGLPSHPQHELASRQMSAGGTLVAFDVVGGTEAGARFVEAVRVAQHATSLGGPETLVTHPASTTHVNLLPDELAANGIGPGTIRVSIGLEHPDDLIADLTRALAAADGA
ncbi:MAG: aminotransferase class I/II-fold pyridoxal phosphate-dependent enzyme [Acidimicrobiales bacterium]|nr:aminotransferase class I/II-fold pyridoxal phosphate-dependent enzyme [Acidimicrobiales bacterium]